MNIVEEIGSKYFRFVSVVKCYNFNLYTLDIFEQKDKKNLAKRTTNFLEHTNNSAFRSAFDLFVHFTLVRRGRKVQIRDTSYFVVFVQFNRQRRTLYDPPLYLNIFDDRTVHKK